MGERPDSVVVPVRRARPGFENLPLPTYETAGAAGMDLRAAVDRDVTLAVGGRALIPTGLVVELPEGFEAQIRPRSGLALKHGVTLLNAPGTIDSDYRGEIQVIVINHGEDEFVVRRGDRVAQMVVAQVMRAEWREADRLGETERGSGGFGHTGLGKQRE